MKIKPVASKLLAITLMLGLSQVSLASDCSVELDFLSLAIGDAGIVNVRDEDRLNAKVSEVIGKLQTGKPSDALLKLDDIRLKVVALRDARKTKIDSNGADAILMDVESSEACVLPLTY